MSWTQLRDNFSDLSSAIKNFGKDNDIAYPYPTTLIGKGSLFLLNNITPENWNKSLPYSFKVVDKRDNTPAANFGELTLAINPLEITQDENFAINLTPTQDGVISEHNGIVFRDLQIVATTGIHPFRGTGGVTTKGKAIGAGADKRSGYVEFQRIRNYFRAYALHKKQGNINRNDVLVYVNRKDNENLVIEPLKFSKKRSGARGKLYDYIITAKAIGNLDPSEADNKRNDLFEKLDDTIGTVTDFVAEGRGILLKSAELLGQVEREIGSTIFEPLRQIDLFVKGIAGIGTSLGDMSDNLITRFNSNQTLKFLGLAAADPPSVGTLPTNIQKAAQQGGGALLAIGPAALVEVAGDEEDLTEDLANDFALEKESASQLTRVFFEDFKVELERVRDNAAEAFGLGAEAYNTFAGRTETFTPSLTKQTTNEEQQILFGFMQIQNALNLILAYGNSEFQKNIQDDFSEAELNFSNEIDVPVPVSVNEVFVAAGQSLEDIAFIELNDINRWVEIAKLNNLKPPYITDVSTDPRIKQPGDRILLPSTGLQIDTNVLITKENRFNQDLNETEKRLGIDFLLNDNFDLVFNNAGDIELAVGGANAKQAIRIKFNTEKGDLRYHPQLGVGLIIGEKNTLDFNEIYDQIVGTILQDPRFSEIPSFDLRLKDGNTLVLNMNLLVSESATPIPIDINL